MFCHLLSLLFPIQPPLPLQLPSVRPRYSPIYRYSRKLHTWIGETEIRSRQPDCLPPSQIQVLSWNINFSNPRRRQRLDTILAHISEEVFSGQNPPPPCIVLFQEVHRQALPLLLAHPFVRAYFVVSTLTHLSWPPPSMYGNVTLISTNIRVRSNFTVDFPSSVMGRHAVFVDILLSTYTANVNNVPSRGSETESKPVLTMDAALIRVANVQLESFLGYGERARPHQLLMLSNFLHSAGLHGGVVAGDMGVIATEEDDVIYATGLIDAAQSISEEAYTWGDQPPNILGRKRLDRIYTTHGHGVHVDIPAAIGVGLKVSHGEPSGVWASDHFGLLSRVQVSQAPSTS